AGMSPDNALAAARRQVGNTTHLREQSRDAWGFPAVDIVLRDVRYALRGLARAPGFTVTVVVTLALGIGANAAMFGVIDRLMFRPFPYMRDPAGVNRVYLQTSYQGRPSSNTVFPYLRYLDLANATNTVDEFAAESEWRLAIGTGDASRVGKVAGVSASLFKFFDATPVRGRFFTAAEDEAPSGTRVAVISHGLWINDFNAGDVVGRRLKIGKFDFTIIGVAPPGFRGTVAGGPPDVFVPITTIPANMGPGSQSSYLANYNWDWTMVLLRRKPGASDVDVGRELTAAYIRSRASARALNPRVLPDSLVHPAAVAGPVKSAAGPGAGAEARVLLWVTGVAAIVLLIACANVANLMFVRVIRRRREITVRLALGVSRARLAAQFVTEAVLLSLFGCAAGVVVAQWGGVAIRGLLLPEGSPFNLATDWRTLSVAFACAVIATLLTAIGPAIVATRTDLAATLKAGAREGTFHRSRTRTALLVFQAALSVVLLVGAGLFVRSFDNARSVPLGYDARPVIEVVLDFRGFPMDSAEALAQNLRLLAAARALPGVAYATRINSRLFGTNTAELRVAGIDSVEALGRFNFQMASPDYFNVMQMRILRGRPITPEDRAGTPPVVVVSDAMGRALWPGRDPLGQCIRVGFGERGKASSAPCTTVVGIAENSAQQNLSDDPRFMYYLAADQAPWPFSTLLLRMKAPDAASQMEGVRRALTQAMPGDGFVVVRPLQEVVDNQSRSWRLGATLFMAFGGLALVVAIVGLYGVISYTVAQRMHELGVRIALGAAAGDVVRLVVWQGVRVAIAGVAIGLLLALVASRWVQPLLFRLSATDPVTYGIVGAGMLVAALAASAIPTVRAVRADPVSSLRAE
ncbi:MAG TPA: ADOP family duplicated permease, partial [Gemmatimonadaceae bacterium]